MEPRISLVTLGVADLGRAQAFYEAMGWHGQTVSGTVFIQAGHQAVVLWPHDDLAADGGVEPPTVDRPLPAYRGVALAHNVRTRDEVDTIMQAAAGAGASIRRPAADTFYGGYAGYFTDPDGHLWEVAHNPGFTLTDDGSLVLPDFGTETGIG